MICQLNLEAEMMTTIVREERRRAHRSLKATMMELLTETYTTCAAFKGKNCYKRMQDTMKRALLPADKDHDIFEQVKMGVFDSLKVSIYFTVRLLRNWMWYQWHELPLHSVTVLIVMHIRQDHCSAYTIGIVVWQERRIWLFRLDLVEYFYFTCLWHNLPVSSTRLGAMLVHNLNCWNCTQKIFRCR